MVFQPELTDSFPIKKYNNADSPVMKTIAEIKQYGIEHNLGDSFMLLDVARTYKGFCIRYFYADTEETDLYYATGTFLQVAEPDITLGFSHSNLLRQPSSVAWICSSDGSLGYGTNTVNFLSKTINGVQYDYSGGNTSGDATYKNQVIYVNGDYNIYIDNVPLIQYDWFALPSIEGKAGRLNLAQVHHSFLGQGEPKDIEQGEGIPILDELPQESNLRSLYGAYQANNEKIIVYAKENYLTMTWLTTTTFTLKWYMADGTLVYSSSYALNTTADEIYLMMLWDVSYEEGNEHFWIRPSILRIQASNNHYVFNQETGLDVTLYNALYAWLNSEIYTTYPSAFDGDDNEEEGGDGYGIQQDEVIGDIVAPTISAYDTGFNVMYFTTDKDKIKALSAFLNDSGNQFESSLFGTNILEGFIGLMISPVKPECTAGENQEVEFMGKDSGVLMSRLTNQFRDVDMGYYTVPKELNTYLSYNPFVDCQIVLPFCGSHSLDIDDIMGKTLHLKYAFDFVSGTCIARVLVDESLHYVFDGRFMVDIPTTRSDHSQMMGSAMSACATIVSGMTAIASGGMTAPLGVASLASLGNNMSAMHPRVQYCSGGNMVPFYGLDKPFLIFSRPILARPAEDHIFFGMPSYIKGKVSSFEEFAKFSDIHLDNVPCNDAERTEIMAIMKEGVRIQAGSSAPNVTPTVSGDLVIVFLKTSSDNNVLGKTWDNEHTLKIEGKLLYQQSLESPVILINGDAIDYNYCYIPLFKRYYYVTDITFESGTMQKISLKVDVLQSFKTAIRNCDGIVTRSTNRTNYLINDGAITTQANKRVLYARFRDSSGVATSFPRSDEGYVLIVTKGYKPPTT